MTTPNQNQSNTPDPNTNSNDKLYAGKFKSVEELETGYKNAASVFEENTKLKAKVEEFNPPETYMNPSDVELEQNRISDIQARAKESGMTQAQYEKFVRGDKARLENHKQAFETAKKEVGEETLNILNDYVSKHYPKELQDSIIKTFIGNKEARQAALNHRQQLLSNQMPGMDKTPALGYRVTDDDVKKAYAAKEANRGDMKARQHYMNLIAARANQVS